MQEILTQINKTPGVRGSMVIAPGGLVVTSSLSGGEDPNELGAMASSVYSALSSTLAKLEHGAFHRYVLSGKNGAAVLMGVGPEAQLLVLLRTDVNMGMVLVELKDAARKLGESLHL